MMKYGLIAALLAVLGLTGKAMLAEREVGRLEAELARTQLALSGCQNDAANLREDKESDDEIDRMSDDDLLNPPADWMLGQQ